MAVCQQKGFNPLPLEWFLDNHYGALLPYHAATELQQLWRTYELRLDQLLPDWPPLTSLGAFWMEVFLVHPRRIKEVRPREGCRAPSIRGGHLGTRSSILTCNPRVFFPAFLEQPIFLSVRLIRKYNSFKSCCQALNVHWQDYCHLISSKYQNRDGMIT